MEEFVQIDSGGERLLGVWTRPEGVECAPATVITLHGWGGYRIGPHRMIVKLCRELARAGIASLRFDFRGRGDSTGLEKDATLDTMIDDARRTVDFARSRAPDNGITLWGICSGGNVAIGAASLERDVRNLILLSTLPFVPQKKAAEKIARGRTEAGKYFRKLFRAATWKKVFTGTLNFRAVRRALFGGGARPAPGRLDPKDSTRDIMAAFSHYAGTAHFTYGGADREAKGAIRHYRDFTARHGIPAAFETIEGSNHDFYSLHWEQRIVERTISQVKKSVG